MIIYNDYKNEDWLNFTGDLPRGTIIIINNQDYNDKVVSHLWSLGYKAFYSQKLYENPDGNTGALDAENYKGDLKYPNITISRYLYTHVVFPEDLGGEKYEGYADFLLRIRPRIVCIERTYNVWKPWELLRFWLRNKYLRDKWIKTYIGIWPESLPWICQKIQLFFAKIISGNQIFWYSETKSLPGRTA